MDGRSLLTFAQNPILHSGRDLLLETPTYAAIRTPNWLYAEHVTGEKELYNLARDRDQLNSLHNDLGLASVRTNLASRLARLRGCSGAACRRGPQIGLRSTGAARPELPPHQGPLPRRRPIGRPGRRRRAFYIDGHLLKRDRRRPFTVDGAEALRQAGRLAARGARVAHRLAPPDARPHDPRLLALTAIHSNNARKATVPCNKAREGLALGLGSHVSGT